MLFLVTHAPDPRPALVVETTPRIGADVIERLKQRLLGLGCPNGLLFDADECVILRNTYISLEADSFEEDGPVPTERLLAGVSLPGRTLDQRVLDWLHSMAASWSTTLPVGSDVAVPFIMNVVPAVSGSLVREVA